MSLGIVQLIVRSALHVCGLTNTANSRALYVVLVGIGRQVESNAVISLSKQHDLCAGQGSNEARITKAPPHLQFFVVINFF